VRGGPGLRVAFFYCTAHIVKPQEGLQVQVPTYLAYLNAETAQFEELKAIRPEEFGQPHGAGEVLGPYLTPADRMSAEFLTLQGRFFQAYDVLLPAFAAGPGPVGADVKEAAAEFQALFPQVTEGPLLGYYHALAREFFTWLESLGGDRAGKPGRTPGGTAQPGGPSPPTEPPFVVPAPARPGEKPKPAPGGVPPASERRPPAPRDVSPTAAGPGGTGSLPETLPASPAAAPQVITLTPELGQQLQQLAGSGADVQCGGWLVRDSSGSLRLVPQDGGAIPFCYRPGPRPEPAAAVVGLFHTHPEPGGFGFSAGDLRAVINQGSTLEVLGSGGELFLVLRTGQTPAQVAESQVTDAYETALRRFLGAGQTPAEATRRAAAECAARWGLAYYEGKAGRLTKVAVQK
jgi:hypothetical protein